jgi:DNA-binding transcriptional regulator GbsR (MarR family)
MTDKTELSKGAEAFILNWAEAVAGWGLPRSAGRLHGLLLVSEQPMAANDLAMTLGVARSNVSTSLRELMAMGLVEAVPEIGQRRTRYAALSESGTMAAAVFAHQKARLFDPAREVLAKADVEGVAGERLAELRGYASGVDSWLANAAGPSDDGKPKKKKKKKG